jgi:hypothetical protein
MLRKAEGKDKADISKLHYMAGEHFFNYFLASTKTKALKILDHLYEPPDTIFSKDFFWVHEDQGTIQGAMSLFPGMDKKLLEENIGKQGKDIVQIAGLFKTLKMMLRLRFMMMNSTFRRSPCSHRIEGSALPLRYYSMPFNMPTNNNYQECRS